VDNQGGRDKKLQGVAKESRGRKGAIGKAHGIIGIKEAFPVISKIFVGSAKCGGEHFFWEIV
jgi:hypothetical protein